MGSPTGPQGRAGAGGPQPPEGYGPPPLEYGRQPSSGGPPPQMSGTGPMGPPQPRRPESAVPSQPRGTTSVPRSKGFLGSLVDFDFDYMVAPTVIKVFSVLTLLLISVQCVIFLGLGLWIASWQNFWAWGLIMAVASPFVWLFEALLLRISMESIIVRFKTAEYLRVIKDKL